MDAPIAGDLGVVPDLLTTDGAGAKGVLLIDPAGAFIPLRHDLTNQLLIQLVGRNRVLVVSPNHSPALTNGRLGFSDIGNLEAAAARGDPALEGMRVFVVDLGPGDALFLPIGWWHQVRALDFSVSVTHTNFVWPNDRPLGLSD